MTIINDTYIPYEYSDKVECLKHVESRCHNLKKSLRFIEDDEGNQQQGKQNNNNNKKKKKK